MFNYDSFFQADNMDYLSVSKEIKAGEAQLVDIREKNEWDQAHFRGAIHVPLSKLAQGVGIEKLKKIKN